MAPTNEFAFEGDHHYVKICLGGEMEANMNSEVPSSFAGWDPFEAFVSTPFPSSFPLARPDGSGFVLVYFRSGKRGKRS